MSRRIFSVVSILVFALSSCSKPETETTSPRAARDLNVLLITLDTTRPDHLSCYGAKTPATPNLDQLAKRGALFNEAVVQVPLTLPSHACILTGAYPQVHKVRDNGGFHLDPEVPTLATLLESQGLETAAFVGAAVLSGRYGLNRGFRTYRDDMKETAQAEKLPGVVAEVAAEVVSRRALAWLGDGSTKGTGGPGKRFFIWLHYYDPHIPYDPPEPFRAQFRSNPYAGEIAYTDAQVGRVLDWLREKNLDDETVVIVIGDHGESLGEHGEYTHGVFLYDSTVRVPLIIAGPGVAAGSRIEQQVRSIDIMPTVLDFLGLPKGTRAQGESLLPLLTTGRSVRNTYSYMETLYPKTAMGWSELRGVRDGDWKLIVAPRPELYSLKADREERVNVIGDHGTEAERLTKRVWEVAGDPRKSAPLSATPLDDKTRRELESLGYLNVSRPREIRIDMSGADPKDRVHILGINEKTAELINHDRYREAIPMLVKAITADPQNPTVHTRLALCYERTGLYPKAIEVYSAAIRHGADNDHTYAELGELYVRVGDLAKAVTAMERAAELNPANLQNLTNLAMAHLELGRMDQAEKTASSVLAQKSDASGALNVLGLVAISRGDGKSARTHFERAITADPDFAQAYLNLGLLADKAGQPEIAIGYFRQFLQKAPPDKFRDVIPKVKEAIAGLQAAR